MKVDTEVSTTVSIYTNLRNVITFIGTVERRRAELKLSKRELASRAGLSHTAIVKMLKGESSPRPATVRALARALEMDEMALLREAGVLTSAEARPEDEWARRVLAALETLPPDLKPRAVEIFEASVRSLRGLTITPAPASARTSTSAGVIIGEAVRDDSARPPDSQAV